MPETEISFLHALCEAKRKNIALEESELQKIELISKHLSALREELAKFDCFSTDSDTRYGNLR